MRIWKAILPFVTFFVFSIAAQTPGTVTVTTVIIATAGNVTCTITPGTTLHVECKLNTQTLEQLLVADLTLPTVVGDGPVVSITKDGNSITFLVKKTNSEIRWQIAANGFMLEKSL